MICKQCQKETEKYIIKEFCSKKCYEKWRYDNNINGRKDKLKVVNKMKKNRRKYIKTLTTQQLLELIEKGEI